MKNITDLEVINSTPYDEDVIRAVNMQWIIYGCMKIPFAMYALYLVISQTAFLVMKYRQMKRENDKTNFHDVLIIGSMNICASALIFLRIGVDLRLVYGFRNDFGCNVSQKFDNGTYGLSIQVIYSALWLKQRVLYQNPALKHLSSKLVRGFSIFTFIILLTTCTLLLVLFLVGVNYSGTPVGCLDEPINDISANRWLLFGTMIPIFQVCLLSLFIYPLVKHYSRMRQMPTHAQGRNPVTELIKRATIMTIMTVITDMLCWGTAMLIKFREPESLILFDADLVINLFCLVLSFPDWKERFMPWRLRKENRQSADPERQKRKLEVKYDTRSSIFVVSL